MGLCLYFCAVPIASFFRQPLLIDMTRVMSTVIIINAFAVVPRAKLTKDIDFKSQTLVTFVSSLASGLLGIILALNGFGVWALVWQQIACQILITILLWPLVKWIPRFVFSYKSFVELWNYGWKLIVSSLLGSVWQQMYEVVIGKCYSPYKLGLYTRASQFSGIITNNITSIIQRVSFPVLSKIQDDTLRLKSAYKHITCLTMFVTFLLMFGLLSCAKSFIYITVGEKWMECVPMMQLLCLQMSMIPLHGINSIAILVVGRSDITLRVNILKSAINTIPLFIGILTNIYMMLIGSIITNFICFMISAYYSGSLIRYSVSEQLRDIFPSFVIALIMTMIILPISFVESINLWIMLPIQISLGLLVVIVLCKLLKISEFLEITSLIKKTLQKICDAKYYTR